LAVGKTSNTELRRRFKVKKLPMLLLLSHSGEEIEEWDLNNFNAGMD
jgi:thioredoxin-related protein